MRLPVVFTLTYATVCAVSALLAWLTGYNFDQRSGVVAMWVALTIALGAVLAGAAVDFYHALNQKD